MLNNDPPPGTRVRFVMEFRKAKAQDVGTLVRALGKYDVDRPGDLFEVRFGTEVYEVPRQVIDKA